LLDRRPRCYSHRVTFPIELEQEDDGRWLAEVPLLPASCVTAQTAMKPLPVCKPLPCECSLSALEHREAPAEFLNVTFEAA
jgi:hypothetical protein